MERGRSQPAEQHVICAASYPRPYWSGFRVVHQWFFFGLAAMRLVVQTGSRCTLALLTNDDLKPDISSTHNPLSSFHTLDGLTGSGETLDFSLWFSPLSGEIPLHCI